MKLRLVAVVVLAGSLAASPCLGMQNLDFESGKVADCTGADGLRFKVPLGANGVLVTLRRRAFEGRLYDPLTMRAAGLNEAFGPAPGRRFVYFAAFPASLCDGRASEIPAVVRASTRMFAAALGEYPEIKSVVVVSLPGGCPVDWKEATAVAGVTVRYDANYYLYEAYSGDYDHWGPSVKEVGYTIRDDGRVQSRLTGSPFHTGYQRYFGTLRRRFVCEDQVTGASRAGLPAD